MRRATSSAALVAVLGSVALLAGCSSATAVQAQTASTDQATSSATSGDGGGKAPKVARPLDASKVVANPCSALTSADVAALHVTDPISKPTRDANGTQCGWQGATGGFIGIGWVTTDIDGLSDLYEHSNTIAYWQPTTVDAFPAAFGDSISDGRAQGDCVLHVAVNDHLFFDSQFNNPSNTSQSCDLAKRAASDVIKNLGGS